jgi:hypothetical protein
MKRTFKQWWSTIPPISTKQTITSPPQIIDHENKLQRRITLEIQVQSSELVYRMVWRYINFYCQGDRTYCTQCLRSIYILSLTEGHFRCSFSFYDNRSICHNLIDIKGSSRVIWWRYMDSLQYISLCPGITSSDKHFIFIPDTIAKELTPCNEYHGLRS